MKKFQVRWLGMLVFGITIAVARAQPIAWVNEFHYDNLGPDTGEFVEVFVSSSFSGNLSELTLTRYNGKTGVISGADLISGFNLGTRIDAGTFYYLAIPGLQNGNSAGTEPDGFSLDHKGSVLEFISYEGSFMAVEGVAARQISRDIGVFEREDSPVGQSLGLVGQGHSPTGFLWSGPMPQSIGSPNPGQTIHAVPEPGVVALVGIGLIFLVARRRNKSSVAPVPPPEIVQNSRSEEVIRGERL